MRTQMEGHFGVSLDGVRVHTGPAAFESARAVQAHAYTVGQHIVFNRSRYAPESPGGRRLLAHEIAHTIQQRGARGSVQHLAIDPGGRSSAAEREADAAAERVMAGEAVAPLQGRATSVARFSVSSEAVGGCGVCSKEQYGAGWQKKVGQRAHGLVQAALTAENLFMHSELQIRQKGSRRWPRTPGVIRNKRDQENGRLDIALPTATGFAIAEIKPSNPAGEADGLRDLKFYEEIIHRRYPDATVERMLVSVPAIPLPFPDRLARRAGCRRQFVTAMMMQPGLIGYFCHPPFSELRSACSCRPKKKKKKKKDNKKKDNKKKNNKKKDNKKKDNKKKNSKKKDNKKKNSKKKNSKKKKPDTPGTSGSANYGLSIGIMSTGGGSGNAGLGIAIKSHGVGYGTVGAGVVYDSSGHAVGSIGAGASVRSQSAGALTAGAGTTKDSSGAGLGTAGVATVEDSTSVGALSAGTGHIRGDTTAGVLTASRGTSQDDIAAGALNSGSGNSEGNVMAVTRAHGHGETTGQVGAFSGGGSKADQAPDAGTTEGKTLADTEPGQPPTGAGPAPAGDLGEAGKYGVGLPGLTPAEADGAVEKAGEVDRLLTQASPAQRRLFQALAQPSRGGPFAVPGSAWVQLMLTATQGIKDDDLDYLATLNWQPGKVTAKQLRDQVQAALRRRHAPPAGPGAITQPVKEPIAPQKELEKAPAEAEEERKKRREALAQRAREQAPADRRGQISYPKESKPGQEVSGTVFVYFALGNRRPKQWWTADIGGHLTDRGDGFIITAASELVAADGQFIPANGWGAGSNNPIMFAR